MFDLIGALLHHEASPHAGACLASLPLSGWPAKHLAQLSPEAEGIISHFQPNSYYCTETQRHFRYKIKWLSDGYGGVTWELGLHGNLIYIRPAKTYGYVIFVKSSELQNKRDIDYHHVLTIADSSEAIILVSTIELAKKLAIPVFQRAWIGNCKAPLPGLKLRPLPYDYWQCIFRDDNRAMATAPALNSPAFNFNSPSYIIPSKERSKFTKGRVFLNLDGEIWERSF
jgi:hypothetical protein